MIDSSPACSRKKLLSHQIREEGNQYQQIGNQTNSVLGTIQFLLTYHYYGLSMQTGNFVSIALGTGSQSQEGFRRREVVQEAIFRWCFEWYNWRLDGIWDEHFLHDRRTVNSKNNYKTALIYKIHDLKLRHYKTKDPYIFEGSYLWYLRITVTSQYFF